MSKRNSKRKYIAISSILFFIPGTLIVLAVMTSNYFHSLPYFEVDAGGEFIEVAKTDSALHVPDFELINQEGQLFSPQSLKGKIWLSAFYTPEAEYIKPITSQLLWVNFKYKDVQNLYIICFSTDPENDTPEVLKAYVDQTVQYDSAEGRWQFLTGEEEDVFKVIREGFKVDPLNKPSTAWLVDGEGYLRGKYNLQISGEVKRAIEEMALLKKEDDKRAEGE